MDTSATKSGTPVTSAPKAAGSKPLTESEKTNVDKTIKANTAYYLLATISKAMTTEVKQDRVDISDPKFDVGLKKSYAALANTFTLPIVEEFLRDQSRNELNSDIVMHADKFFKDFAKELASFKQPLPEDPEARQKMLKTSIEFKDIAKIKIDNSKLEDEQIVHEMLGPTISLINRGFSTEEIITAAKDDPKVRFAVNFAKDEIKKMEALKAAEAEKAAEAKKQAEAPKKEEGGGGIMGIIGSVLSIPMKIIQAIFSMFTGGGNKQA